MHSNGVTLIRLKTKAHWPRYTFMNLRMYISYDIALNMCIYLYYKNAKMNVKDNPIFQMLHNGSDCLYDLKRSVGYI